MSSLIQIIILAFTLALDAVGVSVAEGLEVKHAKVKHALRVAFFFGAFQAFMPLLGWMVGNTVKSFVAVFAPWIAFLLLVGIGIMMIKEAREEEDTTNKKSGLSHKTLVLLAIATSIDAFVVGITLGLINVPLLLSISIIGVVTFLLCFPSFIFGSHLNRHFEGKLDFLAGIALILLGLKIIIEHFL